MSEAIKGKVIKSIVIEYGGVRMDEPPVIRLHNKGVAINANLSLDDVSKLITANKKLEKEMNNPKTEIEE